ncbi:hypothetical protein Q3G72_030152 [Acer saccharum]|nr:hypothetical protein Q3G72_030152 [Acer saccharum]
MKIVLKNVRLAFLKCWKAETVNGEGEPAFSASMILPKDHPQLPAINAAILETAKAKWGAKTDAMMKQMKATDKLALHDGDTKSQYDGFEGNLFIAARTKTRPLTIGRDKAPVTEEDGVLYSGCYANVSIELWAQDNNYGKRINAQLGGIQFVKDGDAFAGGGSAADESDFDELEEGADADLL